jgi:AcrR family transcriptional regulator
MSPRRYRMAARAASVVQTRERIMEAAKILHAEKGVLATSWEEIAERAQVAPATVYRHFPSLAQLIPACARSVFDVIKPPTLQEASVKFAHLDTASARLEYLTRESFHCYERGAGWLHAARRESHLIPALADALQVQHQSLLVLVQAALGGVRPSEPTMVLLKTFSDFPFWESLIEMGMRPKAAADVAVRLARDQLAKEGFK